MRSGFGFPQCAYFALQHLYRIVNGGQEFAGIACQLLNWFVQARSSKLTEFSPYPTKRHSGAGF